MTHLIVAGVPRAGKSVLAEGLARARGLSRLPADSLVSALRDAWPELGVDHLEDHDLACARFKPFLRSWLGHVVYEDTPCVVDLYHLRPADVAEVAPPPWITLYLGYPRVDPAAKLRSIRGHAGPGDWTEALDDAALLALVERCVGESRRLEADCAELGLPFFDTGGDFEAAVASAFAALEGS
jgi:hypothetical protein